MISKFNTQFPFFIGLVATICLAATTKSHPEASSSTDNNKSGGRIYSNMVRHIYNNSRKVWKVFTSPIYAKVYFSDLACGPDPSHSPDIVDMVQPEGRPGQIEPRFHPKWVTIPHNLYVSSKGTSDNSYTIGPGCSVAIEFTTVADLSKGTFTLEDETTRADRIEYMAQDGICNYITSIDSKICTLNSPAQGDIIITGDQF